MVTVPSRSNGPGTFASKRQRDAFVRLDAQRRARSDSSTATGVSRNSVNGARLNCTAISVEPPRQPLAGAQVERHAGPPPVVDEQPHGDERLGARRRRRRSVSCTIARRYCPRTTWRRTSSAVSGGTACSTLTFSSRTSSAPKGDRRLHRHERQQLEHVVLHHVAQRAGAGRSRRRACSTPSSSATVICTWST